MDKTETKTGPTKTGQTILACPVIDGCCDAIVGDDLVIAFLFLLGSLEDVAKRRA
jgi:hypothetical protein